MTEEPKRRKVRFTVNLTEQEQFAFMRRVNAITGVDMSEWRVIKDDKALYDSDPIYKNICKRLNQAAKDKSDYQWKHLKE
ncbi:MAG: hypothetical protein HRU40_07575 [Saprospiraceae bacterium]|nr:hypothetical protein [Saprospiraceae bacterium]